MSKQPIAEQITISSTTESLEPSSAEQPTEPVATVEDLLEIEDLPFTPLVSQGEGYIHGISIDSMIITLRVPILGEALPNMGTNKEIESSKVS